MKKGKLVKYSDREYLERCIALAEEALADGDEPFGSVLVSSDGTVLREARNRAVTGDPTQHPEFELARWAAQNLAPDVRRAAIVYTSGEHCPMCAAAHAWAGLGPIVIATSTAQLTHWMATWDAASSPITALAINQVAPYVPVFGPFPELEARVRALHHRRISPSSG
jgi:tRNA(Arg) A34 adenosine deaminase TadA